MFVNKRRPAAIVKYYELISRFQLAGLLVCVHFKLWKYWLQIGGQESKSRTRGNLAQWKRGIFSGNIARSITLPSVWNLPYTTHCGSERIGSGRCFQLNSARRMNNQAQRNCNAVHRSMWATRVNETPSHYHLPLFLFVCCTYCVTKSCPF